MVYPRVGGGNERPPSGMLNAQGLSPRGRGKQRCADADTRPLRSIPAWAGETQTIAVRRFFIRVYPRVGGGNRRGGRGRTLGHGLSPRGRGKPST